MLWLWSNIVTERLSEALEIIIYSNKYIYKDIFNINKLIWFSCDVAKYILFYEDALFLGPNLYMCPVTRSLGSKPACIVCLTRCKYSSWMIVVIRWSVDTLSSSLYIYVYSKIKRCMQMWRSSPSVVINWTLLKRSYGWQLSYNQLNTQTLNNNQKRNVIWS